MRAEPVIITAASWTPTGDGCLVTGYRSIGAELDPQVLQQVREQVGWLIPTHTTVLRPDTVIDRTSPLAVLVATWLLITQQAATVEPAEVDRSIRKAYARSHRPAPQVRLVRIHRTPPQRRAAAPRSSDNANSRLEYRDWVRGFFRSQPYGPHRSLRKTVWVKGYWRGPADAPVRPASIVRILGSARTSDTLR